MQTFKHDTKFEKKEKELHTHTRIKKYTSKNFF